MWGQNFEIDLTKNPVDALPSGVTQISYPQNGVSFNGSQHGWCWYAIEFAVDGPVKITLGGCQHINEGYEGYVTDASGNKLADIDNRTPGCSGTASYSYLGEAGTLRVYCGQYCPSIRVEELGFNINLMNQTPTLPDGVTFIGYPQNGNSFNSAHGQVWYAIQFSIDTPVKITLGGCNFQNNSYGYLTDANGVKLHDFENNSCSGTDEWTYSGSAGSLKLYCGQYCPSIKVVPCQVQGELPKYTVTYYDANGTTVLGSQEVTEGEKIGTLAVESSAVTVASDSHFRRWKDNKDTEVNENTKITADLNVYACVTAEEKKSISMDYTYDFGKPYYDDEHEIATATDYRKHGSHGWDFKPTSSFSVQVAGPAKVYVGLCNNGNATYTLSNGSGFSTEFSARGTTDKELKEVVYNGGAGTLTLTANAQAYLHSVRVVGPQTSSNLTAVTTSKSMNAGDTYTLASTTDYTTSGTGAVTFASNNTDVATVNETTGEITAVAAGTATITISQAADANYQAGTATIELTVSAAPSGEEIPERIASWDFQNATPSSITTTNIQGKTGEVESDIESVVLSVDATNNGKLQYNSSGYAQFNANTIISVPIRHEGDIVTVVAYPGQYNYTVSGIAASANTTTYTANDTDAKNKKIDIVATSTAYLYSISVKQIAYSSKDVPVPTPEFTDFELDFTGTGNASTIAAAQSTQGNKSTVGIGFDNSGNPIVAESNPVITFETYYHGTTYGLQNPTATFHVPGPVKITMGMTDYSGTAHIANSNNSTVGELPLKNTTAKYTTANPVTTFYIYKGEEADLTITDAVYIPYIKVESYTPDPSDDPTFEGNGIYDAVVENKAQLLAALADADGTNRYKIYVKNGTYDLGTTINTEVKSNVSIIGESQNGVVIKNKPTTAGLGSTSTLKISGDNVYIENVTLKNEYPYTGNDGVAVALWGRGTNNTLRNVTLDSNQDTYWTNGGTDSKYYLENCTIKGTVDYICGTGNVWFEGCTLYMNQRSSGGVIVAPQTDAESAYGYVFNNCVVDGDAGQAGQYRIGRPWGGSPAATFINTTFKILPNAAGYDKMTDNLTLRFHEYGSKDASGNAITGHNLTACNGADSSDALYIDDISSYTLNNFFNGQEPTTKEEPIVIAKPIIQENKLKWKSDTRAIAYYIYKDGSYKATVMANGTVKAKARRVQSATEDMSYDVDDPSANWTVSAINQLGAVGEPSPAAEVSAPTAFQDFEVDLTVGSVVLPTGVKQFSYPKNGAGYNGGQHGWQWYAIEFDVDGPVDIFLGCCQHSGTNAKLEDIDGNVIAESIDSKTPGCNGLVKYSYTGGAKKLKLYCGQYCPYIRVAKVPTSDYTAVWDWTTMSPSALNTTIEGKNTWLSSNQSSVPMYVGAATGKYRANGSNVQLSNGTKLIIPVYSTSDKLSVEAYPGYIHYSINGVNYETNVEDLTIAQADVTKGFVEIASTDNNCYLKKITFTHAVPPTRTFKDFKIDFRTQTPTIILPDNHVLPDGISYTGSYNGGQHGWQYGVLTVPVDGPVKFTIGGCQYGSNMVVKDSNGNTLETLKTTDAGCSGEVVYIYNSLESKTLKFDFSGGYVPYFFAEACEYVPECKVNYYNVNGTLLESQTVAGSSALTLRDATGVTVAEGSKFRGWKYEYDSTNHIAKGKRAKDGDAVNQDIDLYACVTAIEVASTTMDYTYDFSQLYYDDEHEIATATNYIKHGSHGWDFKPSSSFAVQVVGPAKVYVGLCQHAGDAKYTLSNGNGFRKEFSATGTDSEQVEIDYPGGAGTLTLSADNQAYLHSFRVVGLEPAPEWESFEMTLNAEDLLTSEEITSKEAVEFGISLDSDGKVIRVAKDASNAIGVVSGNYHSDHGMNPFSMKLKVSGPVKIYAGTCTYGTVQVKVNGTAVGDAVAGDGSTDTCWKNDHSRIATGIYEGEAGEITITTGTYTPYIKVEKIVPKEFKEFALDFTTGGNAVNAYKDADNNNILDGEGGSPKTIGIFLADDGTPSFSSNTTGADLTFYGKWNGNQYGVCGESVFTVDVPGPVIITYGTTQYSGTVTIKNSANEVLGTLDINGDDYYGHHENVKTFKYTGEATTLTLSGGKYIPYFAIEKVPPRTFTDFKINFRTDPYTVLEPASGLPDGVTVNGTHHESQHGYNQTIITIPVDGPVKFTVGTCGFGSNGTFKDSDGNTLKTLDCKTNGCDSDTSYEHFETWTYNSETPATITFTSGTYIPYFFAEACELIPQCTVTFYDSDGTTVLGSKIVEGNSPLEFFVDEELVTVPEGCKFRSWRKGTVSGKKALEGENVTADLNLYARVTEIERVYETMHYTYRLNDPDFEMEEHDVITSYSNAKFHDNTHGWDLSASSRISFEVEGPTTVRLGLCTFSAVGLKYIIKCGDEEVGQVLARNEQDGATADIRYKGTEPKMLTITVEGQGTAYLHSLELIGGPRIEFKPGAYDDTQGAAPDASYTTVNTEGKMMAYIPKNRTLYRPGYTLTGWTDNNKNYKLDTEYSITHDMTLYPVYKENEGVDLTDADTEVTVRWTLARASADDKNVPVLDDKALYTQQANVNGIEIDVPLTFPEAGKISNAHSSYASVGSETTVTVPAVPGMTVHIKKEGEDVTSVTPVVGTSETTSETYGINLKGNYEYIEVVYPVLPDVRYENVIDEASRLTLKESPEKAGTVTMSCNNTPHSAIIGERHAAGEMITIEATASYGYYIDKVQMKDGTALTSCEISNNKETATATYTITSGIKTIQVYYKRKEMKSISVRVSDAKRGRVVFLPQHDNLVEENNGTFIAYFVEGTEVKVTAEPVPGYKFDSWSGSIDDTNTSGTLTYTNIRENVSFRANFKEGSKGKVIFKVGDAEGATPGEWTDKGWDKPIAPDSIEGLSFTIPTNYSMYWQGHSLVKWVKDGDSSKEYELGETYSFSADNEVLTLVPVYEGINASFFNRVNAPTYVFDFRTKEKAQRVSYGANKKGYWATHIYIEDISGNKQYRDSEIRFDTGKKGKIDNTFMDDWAAIGEGTTLWLPSCAGGQVYVACYAPISTSTIDGHVPELVEAESDPDHHFYLYKAYVHNADNYIPLVIGDDYSYYQYIRIELPAAAYLDLSAESSNTNRGTVEINNKENGVDLGDGVYSFKSGEGVSVTVSRKFGYELDYFTVDEAGKESHPAGGDASYTVTQSNEGWDYVIRFNLNNHARIVPYFKEKRTHYVTYNTGKQAEGCAPSPQWVEAGQEFTIPTNQTMYYEGNTLKYWIDEDYEKVTTDEERNQHKYVIGGVYTALDEDLLLYPVFEPNTFSILDAPDSTKVTWPLAKPHGAPELAYEGNSGILVSQLSNGTDFIDLKIELDADHGKINNAARASDCQIIKGSKFVFPTTKGCKPELTATHPIERIKICGEQLSPEGSSVVANYTGSAATQEVEFLNEKYYYTFSVTYMRQSVTSPELTKLYYLEGDNKVSLLTAEQLTGLKSTKTATVVMPYAKMSESADGKDYLPPKGYAEVTNGTAEITRASLSNPTASIILRTPEGVIADTYTINISVEKPTTPPALTKIVFNGDDITSRDLVNEVFTSGKAGRIELTFDRIMKETDAYPYLNSTRLPYPLTAPLGKTLVFDYHELPAGVDVKVTVEKGGFVDLFGIAYDNDVTLKVRSVVDETSYAHQTFDFVVGVDGTIDEAIEAANAAEANGKRFYIFVPDGEYKLEGNTLTKPYLGGGNSRIADKDGNERNELAGTEFNNGVTTLKRDYISLIGQSQDETIIYNEPLIEGISYTGTIAIDDNKKETYLQDLTLRNAFPYQSSTAAQEKNGFAEVAARGVAFWDKGEKSMLKNVTLDSWQDTYWSVSSSTNASRAYFEDCKIMGVVDFICGDGDVYFERTDLILRDRPGNNIVAPRTLATQRWGYVFHDCKIYREEGATQVTDKNYTLGRPWGGSPAATYINTKMDVLPRDAGWQGMTGSVVLRFHEYNTMRMDGTKLSLGTRTLAGAAPGKGSDDPILTAAEARTYTVQNVLGGGEGYMPNYNTAQRPAVSNCYVDDHTLRWDADAQALCYFVFKKNDETGHWDYITNLVETELDLDKYGVGFYAVRTANQFGGLGAYTEPQEYIGLKYYDLTLASLEYTDADKEKYSGYSWSTICLPFSASVPDGSWDGANVDEADNITVYALTEVSNDGLSVHLRKVNYIKAGVGYVVYAASPKTYRFRATTHAPEHVSILNGYAPEYETKNILSNGVVVGTEQVPQTTPIDRGNMNGYTLAYKPAFGIGFYSFDGSKLLPYRAWLDAEYVTSKGDATSTNAKLSFVFDDDDYDPTHVGVVNADQYENLHIHDLMGRPISEDMMRPGNVYIINGVKVLWKK